MASKGAAGRAVLLLAASLVGWCVPVRAEQIVHMGSVIGGMAGVDPRETKVAMELWAKEMNGIVRKGKPLLVPLFDGFETFGDLAAAAAKGRLDIGAVRPVEWLAMRSRAPMDAVLCGTTDNSVLDAVCVVTRRSGGATSLQGLRRKSVLVAPAAPGAGGILWLENELRKACQQAPKAFFRKLAVQSSGSQALLPVFFGQADACVVLKRDFSTACTLTPQLGRSLAVIRASPPVPAQMVIIVRRGLPRPLRQDIIDAGKRLHSYPSGRQIMTLLKLGRMVPMDAKAFSGLERIAVEHQRLTGASLWTYVTSLK